MRACVGYVAYAGVGAGRTECHRETLMWGYHRVQRLVQTERDAGPERLCVPCGCSEEGLVQIGRDVDIERLCAVSSMLHASLADGQLSGCGRLPFLSIGKVLVRCWNFLPVASYCVPSKYLVHPGIPRYRLRV